MADEPKYPKVSVQLTGTSGNVFAIIGAVSDALKAAEHREAARVFRETAMAQVSYDAVLRLCMATVNVS